MAHKRSPSRKETLRLIAADEGQSRNVSFHADGSLLRDVTTVRPTTREGQGEALGRSQYRAEHLATLKRIADALERLAPPPSEKVDARYIADRLGCTTEWVAKQARDGQIPTSCIVRGTGNGKPWKFYRHKIDKWIEDR